ncbi:MAG TPA: O-antigen ligase family protein [Sphingopyxis sp.]|uniref:O-antigen ligase family protein n=1 Tax=Sphingopyxis sp. TaxID=1908224 RepID=UPI002E304EC8|nr:O-antigen ligase family protein [Sphingopyxis sp.]HEX2812371.1 O-antigen ligase family protein [Sphingopyxis sp.]
MSRRTTGASRPKGASSPDMQGWIAILFLVFVFLTGGGSRSDTASLAFLRGGAVLFAFWAAFQIDGADWRRIRIPLLLLGAMTAWIFVQLIPLPPSMWHGLPGREAIAAADRLLGQADLWRPISLTPSQSLDSLLAMVVPFAALIVFSRGSADDNSRLLFALVCLACLSFLLGFVQILSGPSSGAYFYRITNSHAMVGLFANRNHNAMFLASGVLISAALLRDELMRRQKRGLVRVGLSVVGLGLTVATILVGSRAGLAAGAVAFAVGYLMVGSAWRSRAVQGERGASLLRPYAGWLFYLPVVIMAALLGLALWASDRSTALTRIVGQDVAADMRVRAWATVQSMLDTHWVMGSGFGSFPDVYKIFEPDHLLQPSYFNHAHNDWVEIIITGGLPAAIILLVTILWILRGLRRGGLRGLIKGHRGDIRLPAMVILLLLAAGSVVDYSLRVPSIQVLAVLLIILLCCPKSAITRPD